MVCDAGRRPTSLSESVSLSLSFYRAVERRTGGEDSGSLPEELYRKNGGRDRVSERPVLETRRGARGIVVSREKRVVGGGGGVGGGWTRRRTREEEEGREV